jgi:hypothetical protein
VEIKGDSLLIFTNPVIDTPYIPPAVTQDMVIAPFPGTTVIFNKIGVYRAFEAVKMETVCPGGTGWCTRTVTINNLGRFRILPLLQTTPVSPIVNQPITLRLIVGESNDCFPGYESSFKITGTRIDLMFEENGFACLGTCREGPCPPQKYGPSFDLGTLSAGAYTVYYEDSVKAGTIKVHDILIVNGKATVMQHPYVRMLPRPVEGAVVSAVKAPQCNYWGDLNLATSPETLWTTTGADGAFTLNIPNTGEDYEISIIKSGFHPQTLYTSNYPVMESFPPQQYITFELLQDTIEAATDLEITVTYNKAPVESVSITLSGGREMLICPAYDMGYTDRNGKLLLQDLSMNPYIDYVYSAYKYGGQQTLTKTGLIRLNKYITNQLVIELGTIGIEEKGEIISDAAPINIMPNPFMPATRISLSNPDASADINIYDISGRLIKNYRNVTSSNVVWNAAGLSSGIYILRANIGNKQYSRKLFLRK